MAYEYVCTCSYDAAGLAALMGASEESSHLFGSCSEKGANAKIAAGDAKGEKEKAKAAAALKAVQDAARTKRIGEIEKAMKDDALCTDLAAKSAADANKCYDATCGSASRQAAMVLRYREAMLASSGGAESTKNKDEQNALRLAKNESAGAAKGCAALFPKRTKDTGGVMEKFASCADVKSDVTVTKYGDACTAIVADYKSLYKLSDAADIAKADFTVKCDGDSATGDACSKVAWENGLTSWVLSSDITCQDPILNQAKTSFFNCAQLKPTSKNFTDEKADNWFHRATSVSADQLRFRTLGKNVENPSCLNAYKTAVVTGADKCWAWFQDNQKIDGIDQYLWLDSSTIMCKKADGTTLLGLDNCALDGTPTACTDKQKERQALFAEAGTGCVPPTFTWKLK